MLYAALSGDGSGMHVSRSTVGAALVGLVAMAPTSSWALPTPTTQTVTTSVTALCTTTPRLPPLPPPFITTVPVTLTVPLRVPAGASFDAQLSVGAPVSTLSEVGAARLAARARRDSRVRSGGGAGRFVVDCRHCHVHGDRSAGHVVAVASRLFRASGVRRHRDRTDLRADRRHRPGKHTNHRSRATGERLTLSSPRNTSCEFASWLIVTSQRLPTCGSTSRSSRPWRSNGRAGTGRATQGARCMR